MFSHQSLLCLFFAFLALSATSLIFAEMTGSSNMAQSPPYYSKFATFKHENASRIKRARPPRIRRNCSDKLTLTMMGTSHLKKRQIGMQK